MGRAPCCDKANVKRGPWSPEEDATLRNYLHKHGTAGNWISLPLRAGLKRCGKSCRLRWLNYLRPDIKHGAFSEEEDNIIISLYYKMGSRWSVIAANLPGRTDNDVKNHWNTKLKKKLFGGNNNNKKFNPRSTPKINVPITTNNNMLINPTIFQTPPSSSTPTPTYINNNNINHIYNYDQNHNHHHQFYVPTIPSFSTLLAQCTTLTNNLDHPNYSHDPVLNPSLIQYPVHQSSTPFTSLESACPPEEASSVSGSSSVVYGSSLEDDPFFSELEFGLIQGIMSPTCDYSEQEDIKPQGLGQGVAN